MNSEQKTSILVAKRRLDMAGKPEVIAKIEYLEAQGAPYEAIWNLAQADVREIVKPERETDAIPPPAMTGPGSSLRAWQEYARQVSDIDDEVIEALGRNDLVTVLIDRGVIQDPEYLR